jgi:hypothetical protein
VQAKGHQPIVAQLRSDTLAFLSVGSGDNRVTFEVGHPPEHVGSQSERLAIAKFERDRAAFLQQHPRGGRVALEMRQPAGTVKCPDPS